jgi:hypothetical protein
LQTAKLIHALKECHFAWCRSIVVYATITRQISRVEAVNLIRHVFHVEGHNTISFAEDLWSGYVATEGFVTADVLYDNPFVL